jgi:hypothetical protein
MQPMDCLKIEFGSLKELAEKLEIKPNTVYLWGQSQIPLKYISKIEELSNHKLTREMLRPDLFGEK